MRLHRPVAFALAAITLFTSGLFAEDPAGKEDRARAAFADRDYERGVALLREILTAHPDDPRADYRTMMVVKGLTLQGEHEDAAKAGREFLRRFPESRYLEKVAFFTARALLGTGLGREADEMMAASLERLSGPEMRTRIAGFCLGAADRAFAGRPSAGPFDEGVKPDYARALELYGLARMSGLPPDGRADALLRYARAAARTRGFALVLEVLDDRAGILGEKEGPEALYLRGEALLALLRRAAGRDTLLRVVSTAPRSAFAPQALRLLGDAVSLDRLSREYPEHPLAPEAAFRRGELLVVEGETDRAVLAFIHTAESFPESPFAPRAVLAAADALFAAERYEEGQIRYDGFLRLYPESADWAKARNALVTAWYRRGLQKLDDQKDVEEAARIWAGLRATYPLSPLASDTLLREARARSGEKALALLGEVLARYPGSIEAPEAALRVARVLEKMPGRIGDAVEALKRVTKDYAGSEAAKDAQVRLHRMQAQSLSLRLPRPVAGGGRPALEIRTRNLKELEGRVYRIDPAAYFEKHGSLEDVKNVMVDVIAPDAVFDHQVPGYRDFRSIEGLLEVPVEGDGAYIVVVEGGDLKATGLLLVSGLTLITKESRRGVLAFVQKPGGAPAPGATVKVRDAGGRIHEAATGPDGVARIDFPNASGSCGILAILDDAIAVEGFGRADRELRALETKVHTSTDRPVYRPGHEVRYRVVIRREAGEFRENPAGEAAAVTVTDKAGNRLHLHAGKLSEFGTTAGSFTLPADLPPGTLKIVTRFDGRDYSHEFLVEAYRKPQVFLAFEPAKPSFVRGEKVQVDLTARYAFGPPVRGMRARVVVKGRLDEVVTTDEKGRARLEIPTRPGEDLVLRFKAESRDATGRRYAVYADIPVAETAYRATVTSAHAKLFLGEQAKLRILTSDILGHPVSAEGRIEVARRTGSGLTVIEKITVATGADGKAEVAFEPPRSGTYRFTFRGRDRVGREVVASAEVEVSVAEARLVVRLDRSLYHVGEEAMLTVTSPAPGRHALLTFEGEEVYGHRVVRLAETTNRIPVTFDSRHVPEVWISVALVDGGTLRRGREHVDLTQEVRLELSPEREEYAPGDLCRISLKTRDRSGKPVPAEVALAVVDEGIFSLHPDRTEDLAVAFRPPPRHHQVRTGSSLDFEYAGFTTVLSRDLLAERARRDAPPPPPSVFLEEESLDEMKEFEGPATNRSIGIGGGAGGSFGGRGGHRNLVARGGGGAESLFPTRREFKDTAFFRADVVTGPDGEATVEFVLPDDLTEWRVTGRAASHGNAFGEARTRFLTARPLVVRAALPRFLREGDRVVAAAGVVNATEKSREVTMEMDPAGASGEVRRETVTVAPGEEKVVDWPLPAAVTGDLTLGLRGETETLVGDAEERTLPVHPYGVPYRTGFAGLSLDPGARDLSLPEDAVAGTVRLTLHVAPSLTRAALDAQVALTEFPYGCVEQTVNRFLPALELAEAIRDLGLDRAALLPKLDRTARAGVLRLTYLQRGDGLWGWWRRGGANGEMTAYALLGLARARDAGIEVPATTFEKAVKALPDLLRRTSAPDDRAFLLLARSWAFGADFEALAPAFADRGRLGLKGLGYLALAYEPLGRTTQAEILVSEIGNRVRGVREADPEALGWALAASAGLDPSSATSRDLAVRLARQRRGRGFGTTRQTGAVVLGLARAASSAGGGEGGGKVTVVVNGEIAAEISLARGPVAMGLAKIRTSGLRAGRNRIEVRSTGGGALLYSVVLECVRRQAPPPTGSMSLSRRYTLVPGTVLDFRPDEEDLVRKRGRPRETEVDHLRLGEVVRVTLTVRGGGARYLVVEDPLPAGFEPVAGTESGPFAEAVRHDDRVVFFLENPAESVTLRYLAQGEARGEVRAPPAVTYAMYLPSAAAYSEEISLRVAGADEPLDRDPSLGLSAGDLWRTAVEAKAAGKAEVAARRLTALLDRFELNRRALTEALRLLARVQFDLDAPAETIRCYERLAAEVPSATLDLADEKLRSRAFRVLDRHGEAVASLRRSAWLLFTADIAVPKALGGRDGEALLADLLDRYPDGAYTESRWATLARKRAARFESAVRRSRTPDPDDLRVMREFLARFPESAQAPIMAFRLTRSHLRAGDFETLEAEARRFSDRYPGSHYRDDADWFVAYAIFAQGRHAEAASFARTVLDRTYTDELGGEAKSVFRKNLIHLLAQVAHIDGRLEEAASLYREIADFSVDAREALLLLEEVRLEVPEVVRVAVGEEALFRVKLKNLDAAILDVYPIDLLVYFALEKDVGEVAALNLDGVPPTFSKIVGTDGGGAVRERLVTARLGRLDPGVYLVLTRSGRRERRSIVLVSDLKARIWSHVDGVRVLVTNRRTGAPVPDAFVKVAVRGGLVGEGMTDARGIFEVRGDFEGSHSTVAEKDGSYALAANYEPEFMEEIPLK